MADEQPVTVQKRRVSRSDTGDRLKKCMVHNARNVRDTQIRPLTEHSFWTIQQAANLRQSQSNESVSMDSVCRHIPVEFDSDIHGIHRWCYRNFTNVSRLYTQSSATEEGNVDGDTSELQKSTKIANVDGKSASVVFLKKQCLFCNKDKKRQKEVWKS